MHRTEPLNNMPTWQAVEGEGSPNERGREKGRSRVRSFCALRARLFRLPPIQTPAKPAIERLMF